MALQPSLWQRWVRQPQKMWLRRAIFQVHLWAGLGVGLYIVVVCVSGSAVVFRHELNMALLPPTTVTVTGPRLTDEQLRGAARTANRGFEVTAVSAPGRADRAVVIRLANGRRQRERLFDPYTGKDLGRSEPYEVPIVIWLVDLHDNLLGGQTGRLLNGAGGFLLILLCLTGAVIWWPGAAGWRRGLTIRWSASWKRVNFDLHSAVGFWTLAALMMWAATAVYLVFPDPFSQVVDYLEPPAPGLSNERTGDSVLAWLARLHFGRTFGITLGVLYVIVGLAPAILFVTGGIMWWKRVISRELL